LLLRIYRETLFAFSCALQWYDSDLPYGITRSVDPRETMLSQLHLKVASFF
jgi:hypothetical protein